MVSVETAHSLSVQFAANSIEQGLVDVVEEGVGIGHVKEGGEIRDERWAMRDEEFAMF